MRARTPRLRGARRLPAGGSDVASVSAEGNNCMSRLAVSEIFGPTFQGEGPSIGCPCMFVRLGGCNLHCSWCDTPYTWDWTGRNGVRYDPRTELKNLTVDSVLNALLGHKERLLVVSGGEPLLQMCGLTDLVSAIHHEGWKVEVETAGTIAPTTDLIANVTSFNVSPKLGNSGNDHQSRYRPEALSALQGSTRAVWKFVVRELADLEEIQALVDRAGLAPIYVMPEGTSAAAIIRNSQLIETEVLRRGWRLTTRLQTLLHGNDRGV